MRPLRQLLAYVLLFAFLVASASALATHQEPKKRLTRADNARARTMLIRRSDLPAGFRAQASGGENPHVDCPASVSEADLTLTGEAEGAQFTGAGAVFYVTSLSAIYTSVGDASASWRRGSSAAGTKCLAGLLGRVFVMQNIDFIALQKLAFPRVSERSIAHRVTLSATTAQGTVPLYVDVVGLMRSRAQALVFVGSALVPPQRSEELRLARIVAGRMASAMRG